MPAIKMIYCLCIGMLHTLISLAQKQETLFIHFDKDIYLPGETAWFKAYAAYNHKPSESSSNFFIGFYNTDGKLLYALHYPMLEGTANGDFNIPKDYWGTKIIARAFTRQMWMLDSLHGYTRELVIKKNAHHPPIEKPDSNFILDFFPEGGHGVTGLFNYLAFKSYTDNGQPFSVYGVIFETATNNIIDSFHSNELGLGKMQMVPQNGHVYRARWKDPNGLVREIALPIFSPYGAVLHVEYSGGNIHYTVSKNTTAPNFDTLHLVALMNSKEIYRAELRMKTVSQAVDHFLTDTLMEGLAQVTLFDSRWNPLQERLVYISPASRIGSAYSIGLSQQHDSLRGRNEIIIHSDMPIRANMSLSVADAAFYENEHHSMKTDLWSGELIGLPPVMATRQILLSNSDLITLTHGWRKYQWEAGGEVNEPIVYNENYLGLNISYKQKDFALQSKAELTLLIHDTISGNQYYKLKQVSQNNYFLDGLVYYDSAKIYYKVEGYPDTYPYLTLRQPGLVDFPDSFFVDQVFEKISPEIENYISKDIWKVDDDDIKRGTGLNDGIKMLENVKLNARAINPVTRRLQELENAYTTGLFRGTSKGYQLNVTDDPSAGAGIDILYYIADRCPGLRVVSGPGTRTLKAIDHFETNPFLTWKNVAIFIDEVSWPEESLETISLSQVAYIKYVPGIVIGSSFTTNKGAVYVYRKKGNETNNAWQSGMNKKLSLGYNVSREFFRPDYAQPGNANANDVRTTLLWVPYIITDEKTNTIKLVYYNNDVSRKVLITLRGFDVDGNVIEEEKELSF
ncbi:MAG: hypothetical protein ABIT96_11065 [Ferruginibacter sp.]